MELIWRVCCLENGKETAYMPAQVPGAVQLDYARAHGWDDHCYGTNYTQYKWMEDAFWQYKSTLPALSLAADEDAFFVCGGIDYAYDIMLNGTVTYNYEGMFAPVELNISDCVSGGDELTILIHPAPKRAGSEKDTSQEASASCKPAVSYGWDWHPRLVPLGIWEDAAVVIRKKKRIAQAALTYTLSDSLDAAALHASVDFTYPANGETLSLQLFDPVGRLVLDASTSVDGTCGAMDAVLMNPALWWCSGHGLPYLYTYRLTLSSDSETIDSADGRVGFRRVRLVMGEGTWADGDAFPKTRNPAPATLELNGRVIFAKGTNWVNPDIFPGRITRETYLPLLQTAKELHFNLLRCWGGAIVNKESFFDICDELGLMVWQEFPLACNAYAEDDAYLKVLDAESRSIITRLRKHPSLAIWCGGNELFNSWSRMTDQAPSLRLLNKNCYELDPLTPFNYTSPLYGMGHGSYVFQYTEDMDVFGAMQQSNHTAYTEFGMPSLCANETYLRGFIPADEAYPLRNTPSVAAHHGYHAWIHPESWLYQNTLERYCGKPADLADLIRQSHWLQGEGYRAIFEEARRQKPYCGMALNWCYNEPWPAVANNSLINYPHVKKPSCDIVAAACRPVAASARIAKFQWHAGELFEAELWMLNDRYDPAFSGTLRAEIFIDGNTLPMGSWNFTLSPNTNAIGPTLRVRLPKTDAKHFKLCLIVDGVPSYDSEYRLALALV